MSPVRQQVSCGGVIYRRQDSQCEIALILRSTKKGEKIWCLPKGLMQEGETPEETALREVREETGLEGKVIKKLGEIQYFFYSPEDRTKIKKTVHLFLLEYIQGSVTDHDFEVEEARWFPIDKAIDLMTYENERETVRRAKESLVQ